MNAREGTNGQTGRASRTALAAVGGNLSLRLVTALLAVLIALTLALASRAEAYVYWLGYHGEAGTIEEANPTIGRANLDGTGVKGDLVVLRLRGGGGGLAVDDAHLYWANTATHEALGIAPSIGRANLDGTGRNHGFIADVNVSFASGVAVDDEHVYWVSKFGDDFGFKPASGAIGRANLDGTGVDESFISGVNFPSGGVAVEGSHLYWTSYSPDTNPNDLYSSPSRIGRADVDGTGVEENFITRASGVTELAVDDSHVWWAWQGRFAGGIARANLDGTGVENVIGGGEEDPFPCGIAVTDTHLYWTTGGSIGRANLDGSRATHELITGVGTRCGLVVDALGPPPSNDFSLGKARKNRRKGTAKLTVVVPGPGELELAKSKKVKADEQTAEAAGNENLSVKAKGKTRKKLNPKGKAKVRAKVTFTPDGGEASTQSKRVKLIRRG